MITFSSVIKLKASLNDATRGIIYEHHMFVVQATEKHIIWPLRFNVIILS
jgi:hypothetical protein